MEDFFAVLAVAAGFVATGTLTAAAYQVARHFRRINREADRAAAPQKATDADAATVTRGELEAMIRSAVRENAPERDGDTGHIPQRRSETAPRVR